MIPQSLCLLRRAFLQLFAAVRKLRGVETGAPAADPRARPVPCMHFDAAPQLLPGVLMVWDFCHRYRCRWASRSMDFRV